MVSAQMKYMFTIKNTKFYYADKTFMFRGVWIWNGTRNKRVIPFNQFGNWAGKPVVS